MRPLYKNNKENELAEAEESLRFGCCQRRRPKLNEDSNTPRMQCNGPMMGESNMQKTDSAWSGCEPTGPSGDR